MPARGDKFLLCHTYKNKFSLPIVISLAIEFHIPSVAGVGEQDAAHAAAETVLVPAGVRHSHQVAVVDFAAAAFADFLGLFAFDQSGWIGEI